jgi:predicted nucleic acid-binding protein
MYLLDTNVVSELRKVDTVSADPQVKRWAESSETELYFLSSITILELEQGVLLMERRDSRQGSMLRSWLDKQILPDFAGRILPVDTSVARKCAALNVPNPKPYRDGLIAATALVRGLTVVTRNTSDFLSTGVALLDPRQT